MDFADSGYKKYFFILLAIEAGILLTNGFGGQIASGLMTTFFRIVLLLVSYCCVQSTWAALYAVFALISALYGFDPVGLWITGHGHIKTTAQNILCLVAFALCLVASYIGYLYTKELMVEEGSAMAAGNGAGFGGLGGMGGFGGGNNPGYDQPSPNQNYYGGTNYMSQNPSSSPSPSPYLYQQGANRNQSSQAARSGFQPFSGEGHRLS